MTNVYVFIHNAKRLQIYVDQLSFLMMINELEMQVVYAESDFHRFLNYVRQHRIYDGLFIIDADCPELQPLDALSALRNDIGLSPMVLLSKHKEVALESIQKHLYITDLIIKTGNKKEEIKRVEEVLRFCHSNLIKSKETTGYPSLFEIESRSRKIKIPMREVYYIETAHVPHKLLLHSQHDTIEFYGKLADIESRYAGELYRVHRSYVINPDNIESVDYEQRILSFADEQCYFTVSRQKLNQIMRHR